MQPGPVPCSCQWQGQCGRWGPSLAAPAERPVGIPEPGLQTPRLGLESPNGVRHRALGSDGDVALGFQLFPPRR